MKYSVLSFYCIILLVTLLSLPFHTARHTFATLMLANGVSIENVAKMLGHSDTKMTRHYAQILDSSIMRDMEKVQDNIRFD